MRPAIARSRPTGNSTAFLLNVDDVGFVEALIRQLVVDAGIDPRRVYATGFSNGALFAQRLACDSADRISAFASVGATATGARCRPAVRARLPRPDRLLPRLPGPQLPAGRPDLQQPARPGLDFFLSHEL